MVGTTFHVLTSYVDKIFFPQAHFLGTDRAVHQPVARGKRITTGAGLAGTWKM